MILEEAREIVLQAIQNEEKQMSSGYRIGHVSYGDVSKALEIVLKAAEAEGFETGYLHAQETVGDWNRP